MSVTGIIGAEQQEVTLLTSEMMDCRIEHHGGCGFHSGLIQGAPVVVVCCGIGKVNAALCTQILISVYKAERIINTGVAGGLAESLSVLDMVVSTDTVEHDMDATFFGYVPGQVPGTDSPFYSADQAMIAAVQRAWEKRAAAVALQEDTGQSHRLLAGRVASGDLFVSDPAARKRIIDLFAPACVEMEGAAVAHVCTVNKIPFVVLRSISDLAGTEAHLSYEEFSPKAARISAALVIAMLEVIYA